MKIEIGKAYGSHVVFDGLKLDFSDGEIVAILGESGVGKTTLLQILARQIPFAGELVGVPEQVGYAYQEARLLPNLTAEGNLRYAGVSAEEAEKLLRASRLYDKKDVRAHALSGGEKQRVSLCRAVAGGKRLVLLDEPFSSLDAPLRVRLYGVFAELWQNYRPTVVLATHDLEDAWALSDRVIVLREGKVALDIRIEDEKPRPFGEGAERKRQILRALTGE